MLTPAAHSTRLKETLTELGYLTIVALRDPNLFRTDDWRNSLAVQLDQLQQLVHDVREIEVSDALREAQTLYGAAVRKYGETYDRYVNLVETLDENQLAQILSRVREGNQYLSGACLGLEESG